MLLQSREGSERSMGAEADRASYLDRVIVPEGEYRRLQGQGRLEANRLETCLAVGVYFRSQKLGLLGHFIEMSFFKDGVFHEMVAEATKIASVTPDEQPKAWLVGAALLDPEEEHASTNGHSSETVHIANEGVVHAREIALNALADLTDTEDDRLFRQLPMGGIDFSINVANGTFVYSLNQPINKIRTSFLEGRERIGD
ncbi:MAG TPA: hypothetical protein VL989_00795 [Candidatus Sulfotelmatobacter sp.]|nr:hypothetical protein [Candidatus Sulfotelmatobacter sp.]